MMVQPSDDPDWYDKSKVATKDAPKTVLIAWSKPLEERSPAIDGFFADFAPTADEVTGFAHEISGKARARGGGAGADRGEFGSRRRPARALTRPS